MSLPAHDTTSIPLHDYQRAVKNAVSWLGDRYLLAEPQPRRATAAPKYWTAGQHAAAHHFRSTGR